MAGYTRTDTTNNIATGNVINASDLDNEFDAVQAAYNATTGHTHGGAAGEGAPITRVGPVQDVVVSTSAVTPKSDNVMDLGSATNEFKDLYIDGTANIDSLVADTADINGGTIDGTTVGATTASTGAFTTATASTSFTSPVFKATNSAGGALQNSSGTNQLQWGGGGGNNLSVDVAININPANAQVAISPTGTGSVTINPATAGTINNMSIGANTAAAGTFTIATATTGNITTVNATDVDTTSLEVTNIKAKDGTASATIANSTGVMTVGSSVLTTTDINGGTVDGAVIGGATPAAGTFTTATATTGNITTVNATTVDTTNIEVTNIKAKDGTAAATIADATGVVTIPSAVLTTADINGGTIDGAVIGGASAAAGNFTTLGATGVATFSAGTVSAPAITTTGDTNTGIFFPAADTIAFTEGGVESGRFTSAGALQLNANLTFSGTGNRILGDFSNGTIANRVAIQSSTTNGTTFVSVIPNGTATQSNLMLWTDPAYTNYALLNIRQTNTETAFQALAGGSVSSTPMTFATGGSERLRIDTSGNVGIGTSSPVSNRKLTVLNGTTGPTATALYLAGTYGAVNDTTGIDMGNTSGTVLASIRQVVTNFGTGASSLSFLTADNVSLAERMRITSAGLVGINTNSPAYQLEIKSGSIFVGLNSDGSNGVLESNGALFVRTSTGNPLVFGTNTAERMRIDSSGNLLVGTTTSSGRLTIKQSADAGAGGLTFVRQANTNNWQTVIASTNDLYLIYNGTDRGYFSNSTGVYISISDRRLKENIFEIPYGLNSVLALNPVQYNMIDTDANQLGFIAQEAKEVIPESVSEMMDGNLGMDKSSIIPVLVKAIQELKAEFDSVKAELQTLKGN